MPGAGVLGDVTQCVDRGVRLAGADLEQNVAAGDAGLQVVVGERRHLGQPVGLLLSQPEGGVSKRLAPSPTVTVRPSGGMSGPSVPLSDGGATVPRSTGTPPWVRNRARLVNVWSVPISEPRVAAVTLKTAKQAAGGGELMIPA